MAERARKAFLECENDGLSFKEALVVVATVSRVKRDLVELLLGLGVLALGIALLIFTFSQALALAQNPGAFLQGQMPQSTQGQAPTASFSWNSNGLSVNVNDSSQAGSGNLVSWQWDFGDGQQASGQNPAQHTYGNPGPYQVSLIVRNEGNRESRAFAQVDVNTTGMRSGVSAGDPSSALNINFDLGGILLPVAITLLTIGMFFAMAIVGGMITKAGWNLVKPKPETIRVRLKPKDLTQAIEPDTGTMAPPAPPPPQA